MTDTAIATSDAAPRKRGKLLPIALVVVLAGAGFATTFLGLWSPTKLVAGLGGHDEAPADATVVFVDIPPVEAPLPGGGGHSVALQAKIEADAAQAKEIQHLMPRVTDEMLGFLTSIDPAAFERRGVLDIVRAELLTRIRAALGDAAVKDLLITEFRFK